MVPSETVKKSLRFAIQLDSVAECYELPSGPDWRVRGTQKAKKTKKTASQSMVFPWNLFLNYTRPA